MTVRFSPELTDVATARQESAPLTGLKTWKPFLRWPILRPDGRDPLKHVKVTLRLAREPEKRTAMCLGFCSFGIAADASACPIFVWLLALATTFHFEDPHALRTNAVASTNAINPHNFTG